MIFSLTSNSRRYPAHSHLAPCSQTEAQTCQGPSPRWAVQQHRHLGGNAVGAVPTKVHREENLLDQSHQW